MRGQKTITINNCLQNVCPDIATEWHPIKNNGTFPTDVLASSGFKYWFKCKRGHEWESSLNNRKKGSGCPYCANQKVCDDNCLQSLFPEIAEEWDYDKNNLTPKDVIAGSHKKYWFKCKNGHIWESVLKNRTFNEQKQCPYCTGRKVCNDNCLQSLFPEIAEEWDYDKNNLTPKDITGKSGKKFWFKCRFGHKWLAAVHHRTNSGSGCPTCNESKGEKKIAGCLDSLRIKYKRQWRFKSCRNRKPLPFDFVVKTGNGIRIIEYQGEQHYRPVGFGGNADKIFNNIQSRDLLKEKWCQDRNVFLLKIAYWDFDRVEEIVQDFVID